VGGFWLEHPLALLGVAAFSWPGSTASRSRRRSTRLRAWFGTEFERYCSEVRRWALSDVGTGGSRLEFSRSPGRLTRFSVRKL